MFEVSVSFRAADEITLKDVLNVSLLFGKLVLKLEKHELVYALSDLEGFSVYCLEC